jgi:CheY-like chemotaxis protein
MVGPPQEDEDAQVASAARISRLRAAGDCIGKTLIVEQVVPPMPNRTQTPILSAAAPCYDSERLNFDPMQPGLHNMIQSNRDTERSKKNILIVDDHAMVRRGLTELLSEQPDLTIRAAVASAEEALEAVEQQPIDLAIVDISLDRMNGLELTGILKQRHPEVVVLILSMHEEQLYGRRARRAGASGFVSKQQASDSLLDAIHQVLAGHLYYHLRD